MTRARDRSANISSISRRFARATLLGSLVLLPVAPAFADAPAAAGSKLERRVVVLDAAPSEGVDRDLEGTLGELLGRLQLGLVRPDGAGGARIVARVRIETSDRGATLTIESGRRDVPTVRREVERGESTALFRETVAHVVLGAIEPLVGREDDAERPPPPAPVVNAPARTSERGGDPLRLMVGARAGPRFLESDRLGIGFAGGVSLAFPLPLRPSASVRAGYVLPTLVSNHGVDAEFHLVPVRAEVAVRPLEGGGFALETALVGGVDFVSLAPQTAPSFVHPEETKRRVQPMFGGAVSSRFRLSPSADFVLTAGFDVDASPRRWVIVAPTGNDAFFETARVRPYAALGLDFTMLGVPSADSKERAP
jgi:hypothetical protein